MRAEQDDLLQFLAKSIIDSTQQVNILRCSPRTRTITLTKYEWSLGLYFETPLSTQWHIWRVWKRKVSYVQKNTFMKDKKLVSSNTSSELTTCLVTLLYHKYTHSRPVTKSWQETDGILTLPKGAGLRGSRKYRFASTTLLQQKGDEQFERQEAQRDPLEWNKSRTPSLR